MAGEAFTLGSYLDRLAHADPLPTIGRVVRTVGVLIESRGPHARIGDVCDLQAGPGVPALPVEVVGFRDGHLLAVPLGGTAGIRPGARVVARGRTATVAVGDELLGRVLDGLGRPIDGLGPLSAKARGELHPPPLNPLDRTPIDTPLGTGVRAIDALLTCGRGQRLGLFGGSGVGKSTLLGMMARATEADVSVIALVGERGREVRGFIEHDLGEEGLRRSVVVVSTSDNPALLRMRAAYTATAIAEHFRSTGRNVLLMMDSITRFAMAQREVGLAAGEPPTAKGYPPSVFALLPNLLERAGNVEGQGSITGLYTVLVEGDDQTEPIADAVRAILDGHIVLSRSLAGRNHYPAIDVLPSVSRTMPAVTTVNHRARAALVRDWLAIIRENEDLVSVGAYVPGSNPRVDTAFARREALDAFLKQGIDDLCTAGQASEDLEALTQAPPPAAAR
ncbi:MAG TPA: FliI/YscN family ATPase [Vicinamibacterales bacterium]|nr:FliI/YscN family ATPase [Vicinamibacterales bacterium]